MIIFHFIVIFLEFFFYQMTLEFEYMLTLLFRVHVNTAV